MSSIGELVVNLSADTGDLVSGMSTAQASVNQTTTVIVKQEKHWASLTSELLNASSAIVDTGADIARIVIDVGRAAEVAAVHVTSLALQAATAAATLGTFAIEAGKVGVNLVKFGAEHAGVIAGTAALVYNHQQLLTVLGLTVPVIAPITASIAALITGYKLVSVGVSDAADAFRASVDGTGDLIPEYNALNRSNEELKSSLTNLGNAITQPFADGYSAIGSYVQSFSPLPTLAGYFSTALDSVSGAVNYVAGGLREVTAIGVTAAFVLSTGASDEAAASFYEQGQQLQKLAEESERVIAKQEAMRDTFGSLRAMQEGAKTKADNASEIAGVGKMMTTAEIDDATRALQQRSAEAVLNGKADKEWAQHTQAMFDALEKQRQGIEDGTIAKKADKDQTEAILSTIAAAKKSVDELTIGQTETAVAALAAKGATEEQIAQYRALLDQTEALKKAEDAKKKATDEANKAAQEAAKAAEKKVNLDAQAATNAAKLSDEIAVLSGEMTKQEAREAELIRGGMTAKQAAEQAALEAKRDSLSGKQAAGGVGALQKGSAEQVSAVLTAMRSRDDIPKKQLGELEQVNVNIGELNKTIEAQGENGVTLFAGSLS